jgi:arsenate reductase
MYQCSNDSISYFDQSPLTFRQTPNTMIKIYHNPRCRKSREGLQILQDSGKEFEIREYLKDLPSADELKSVIKVLGISPIQLVRKNEAIWKENYKEKILSDDEIIQAMAENPKLIERPIVINNGKAVVGRPPENILQII